MADSAERSCGWCGRSMAVDSLVCPHCGTEATNRVTVRPGRHGHRVHERRSFGNYLLPDPTVRFVGRLVDGLAIGAPLSIIIFVVFKGSITARIGYTLLVVLYEGVCVSVWGRTLGKRVTGTRVIGVRPNRPKPTAKQSFVRAAVYGSPALLIFLPNPPGKAWFDLAVSVLVWLPILTQRQHRGLPDLAAGTIVVEDRPGG